MTDSPATASRQAKLVIPAALIVLGVGAAAHGLRWYPAEILPHLLLNGVYCTLLGVSALVFFAIQRLTGARWSASLRRIPEALMQVLPVASAGMLALFLAAKSLFPWMRPGIFTASSITAGKVQYLRAPQVFVRSLVTLSIWMLFCLLVRRTSLQQDREPERALELHHRITRYAVCFMPLFALTFTFFVFDWLISLEPDWFSTIFAFYMFAGTFVQGIAAVTLGAVLLRNGPATRHAVREDQLHDLGKMLFAFTTFWAYIWVCQYLLIWYGNIPEEVTHYLTRTSGPWLYVFALNFVINWVIPFTTLLSVRAKRSEGTLAGVSVLLLFGRWVDLFLLVIPSFSTTPQIGISQLLIAAGCASLSFWVVIQALRRAPLVPANDPILAYERLERLHAAEPAVAGSIAAGGGSE